MGSLKDAPHSLVTRYRRLYKYLEQEDAVIPLVISEAGENAGGGFTGVETFLEDFAWYDEQTEPRQLRDRLRGLDAGRF